MYLFLLTLAIHEWLYIEFDLKVLGDGWWFKESTFLSFLYEKVKKLHKCILSCRTIFFIYTVKKKKIITLIKTRSCKKYWQNKLRLLQTVIKSKKIMENIYYWNKSNLIMIVIGTYENLPQINLIFNNLNGD